MAWTKDTSQSPVIIYTDSEKPQRVIYDPDAEPGRRFTVEMEYLVTDYETLEDIDNSLGIS